MKDLPIGIQDFRKLRSEDYLYIDKTELIYSLVQGSGYYFLSRPRRFGKSLLISTMIELFQGNKDLFKGLWIENKWDWSKTNPIIHLPFSLLDYQKKGLEQAISDRLDKIATEYNLTLDSITIKDKFQELIILLNNHYGKVALLVDEYDKPIIDYIGKDISTAVGNQQTMKTFYSIVKDMDAHLKMVFITGVSKFSKVSIFSELNNLNDITQKRNYGTLLGYTEDELCHYFKEHIVAYSKENDCTSKQTVEKIREWYNGYLWSGKVRVYNPFSVLNFFDGMAFKNYWFSTGTPTFLIDLLREEVLYDVDNTRVGETTFDSFDIEHKIDLLSLLFQTGYLTIKEVDERGIYTLGYPNKEVRNAFLDYLIEGFSGRSKGKVQPLMLELEDAFRDHNLEQVKICLQVMLANLPYHLHEKTEKFYHAVVHLTFYYLGTYVQSEVVTSRGRADAIVQTDSHIYCFEFKFNKSAEEALEQIKSKNYLEKFQLTGKKLVGIGVNFSTEAKGIDGWKVEVLG
ncbi:ATP-binding protein [Algivirga pacifica]|uniref:ATP-binding protein n=1 Tax=Algivirga pacifica TaxID=1162670 RepID=A0ABP9D257_9BACT